jgi:hypothetical protein
MEATTHTEQATLRMTCARRSLTCNISKLTRGDTYKHRENGVRYQIRRITHDPDLWQLRRFNELTREYAFVGEYNAPENVMWAMVEGAK